MIACMPAVEQTAFFVAGVAGIMDFISGQRDASPTSAGYQSLPSTAYTSSHATYPTNSHLQPDPDPYLATLDNSISHSGSSYKSAIGRAEAAKPAAVNASSAAVGKLSLEMK